MKNIVSFLFAISVCAGAQAAQTINVSGKLQNSTSKDAVVAFYAEYEATSSLPTCKTYSLPELEFRSRPKIKQRLHFMAGNNFQAEIPAEFGVCNYKITSAGVIVLSPEIIKSMLSQGAEQAEDNVIEFKGGLSGIARLKGGEQKSNTLNCAWDHAYSANCDSEEIVSNGSSIQVNVNLKN
ncbi:hypothetical protein [Bdellovibrio sp. HCB337]|uniref:hypothetical protein n=1 Tax=Bdellovibrio sp. HCB337 TaxID=3394358 RepID=UPI0039A6B943